MHHRHNRAAGTVLILHTSRPLFPEEYEQKLRSHPHPNPLPQGRGNAGSGPNPLPPIGEKKYQMPGRPRVSLPLGCWARVLAPDP